MSKLDVRGEREKCTTLTKRSTGVVRTSCSTSFSGRKCTAKYYLLGDGKSENLDRKSSSSACLAPTLTTCGGPKMRRSQAVISVEAHRLAHPHPLGPPFLLILTVPASVTLRVATRIIARRYACPGARVPACFHTSCVIACAKCMTPCVSPLPAPRPASLPWPSLRRRCWWSIRRRCSSTSPRRWRGLPSGPVSRSTSSSTTGTSSRAPAPGNGGGGTFPISSPQTEGITRYRPWVVRVTPREASRDDGTHLSVRFLCSLT